MADSPQTGRNGQTTVSELGESRLIARLLDRIGPGPADELWGGDDAAVVSSRAGRVLATIDSMVEGTDYELSYASPTDVGWKALVAGVSDCAAMGGRPTHCVISVTLRRDSTLSFVDELLDGILEAARSWDVAVVGGDVSGGPQSAVTAAVIGAAERPVPRSGASEGDIICVTGTLGGAAAGLLALREKLEVPGELDAVVARLKSRQLRPRARVAEGLALATSGATAMIDVSDGLGVDLGRILSASDYGCEVDLARIPIDDDVLALKARGVRLDPVALALAGGEDFELLAALPSAFVDDARAAIEELGGSLSAIGTVTAGDALIGGQPLRAWEEAGWDHLRPR
ncbi:MAG: thiamine-phosphate kinase [Actinomycetota bacterium]